MLPTVTLTVTNYIHILVLHAHFNHLWPRFNTSCPHFSRLDSILLYWIYMKPIFKPREQILFCLHPCICAVFYCFNMWHLPRDHGCKLAFKLTLTYLQMNLLTLINMQRDERKDQIKVKCSSSGDHTSVWPSWPMIDIVYQNLTRLHSSLARSIRTSAAEGSHGNRTLLFWTTFLHPPPSLCLFVII